MLLWATLAILFAAGASKPEVCEKSSPWTINEHSVMNDLQGNVTLIALLTASMPFCQQQAERLEALLKEFSSENAADVSFLIVNSKLPSAELIIDDLRKKVSFPIYQDNDNDNVWKILEGGNNDIYIYDKCGRLTYYIPFPFSIIHPSQPIVRAALHSTYFDELCGEKCNFNILNDDIFSDYNKSIEHNYMKINETTNATEILDINDFKRNMKNLSNNLQILVEDMSDEFLNVLNNTNLTSTFNISEPINITDITENIMKNNTLYPDEIFLNISKEKETNQLSSEVNTTTLSTYCEKGYKETCSFWSKNKLKHIKKCCKLKLQINQIPSNKFEITDCRHFGRKKCKKMLPLLKCCLGSSEFPFEPIDLNSTLSVQNETTKYLRNDYETKLMHMTTLPPPEKKTFLDKVSK